MHLPQNPSKYCNKSIICVIKYNYTFRVAILIRFPCNSPDAVIFSLTGSVISIDVSVFSDGLVLNSYQGGQSSIVQDLIGLTLRLDQLKQGLAKAGINLFPEEDTFCYTEGTCEKNHVMEAHLYRCMAALGLTHNFAWSRWNLMAGRRSCVMLMRELLENRKPVRC